MRSDRVYACAGRIPNIGARDVKVSEQVSELERTSDSFSILAGFTISSLVIFLSLMVEVKQLQVLPIGSKLQVCLVCVGLSYNEELHYCS